MAPLACSREAFCYCRAATMSSWLLLCKLLLLLLLLLLTLPLNCCPQ